ncbi:NAD(P)-dependent dehydrogenase (short-subunit alcohol dehydrogenase family) [Mycobacterium sp. BK086]|uniref:SDR family NAD(P)-dependent oxidoreductase n=1 Tax=Mycobacterium sp. BK086 TaxID=2512165 RepID=UPI00105DB349|nr:SDR family NAD(P)-dependent oxidoreductase [Mycobacterium sp. BK086]TDO09973.1 NAD(P)-dependent dehydrogenase (short-subunit alcohol dehydrogenase family) [Mycobacterium sp. BK086]
MNTSLRNCVVLVTGGGRGIGRSHCLTLASLGAAVVVNDPGVARDGSEQAAGPGPAEAVAAEITAAGGRAIAHTGSVASWSDAADMVETAVQTFGTLTGIVNNAGILRDSLVASATEADWDSVIAVHLKGTFAVTHHSCAYWRAEAKAGRQIDAHIVNTVSGSGLWGNVGQAAYGAAKAAIANLTLITAMEAQRYGVAVNAISPLARSRMTDVLFAGRPDDPALDPSRSSPVVAWLQSPESSWLTGQILRIDGGILSRIKGFTESARYQARDGEALEYDEIDSAVRWLWDTLPRGLAGPLPRR